MQTLELVKDHVMNSLNNFVIQKEAMEDAGEIDSNVEGLTYFQLHLASEVLSYQAFIESRDLADDMGHWVAETIDEDVSIDLNDLEDFKKLKYVLSLDEEEELDNFELSIYSKVVVYRNFIKERNYMPDFCEFLNELTIDLRMYKEDIGLVGYLIETGVIE